VLVQLSWVTSVMMSITKVTSTSFILSLISQMICYSRLQSCTRNTGDYCIIIIIIIINEVLIRVMLNKVIAGALYIVICD